MIYTSLIPVCWSNFSLLVGVEVCEQNRGAHTFVHAAKFRRHRRANGSARDTAPSSPFDKLKSAADAFHHSSYLFSAPAVRNHSTVHLLCPAPCSSRVQINKNENIKNSRRTHPLWVWFFRSRNGKVAHICNLLCMCMQLFQPLVCGLLPVGNLCYLLWSRWRGKPAAPPLARSLCAKLFHEYLFALRDDGAHVQARGEFLPATLSLSSCTSFSH